MNLWRQPRSKVEELSLLSRLRDHIKHLEREMPMICGSTDVWKSNSGKASAREKYLLGEVAQLNEKFKC